MPSSQPKENEKDATYFPNLFQAFHFAYCTNLKRLGCFAVQGPSVASKMTKLKYWVEKGDQIKNNFENLLFERNPFTVVQKKGFKKLAT